MEGARLGRLIATGLLDTGREERFDRLTRLASNALQTPIALISLVDSQRQWFKSKVGLSVDETARDVALCDYTIRDPHDLMVVLNAADDPRFRDNPLVKGEPNIAFYAGAPLVTADGYAIGSLCIIDTAPRADFSDVDRQMLSDIAQTVMSEIERSMSDRRSDDFEVINRELQHRMGNMYSQVSGMISLTERSGEETAAFKNTLLKKIQSMAETQALFAANRYNQVSFHELFSIALKPFEAKVDTARIHFSGDRDLEVSERAAFLLTLMLNELTANSVKHGALSTSDGSIEADLKAGERVQFSWTERTQAPASEKRDARADTNRREGFGSRLLLKIVPAAFNGMADLAIEEGGLKFSLDADPSVFLSSMTAR